MGVRGEGGKLLAVLNMSRWAGRQGQGQFLYHHAVHAMKLAMYICKL